MRCSSTTLVNGFSFRNRNFCTLVEPLPEKPQISIKDRVRFDSQRRRQWHLLQNSQNKASNEPKVGSPICLMIVTESPLGKREQAIQTNCGSSKSIVVH